MDRIVGVVSDLPVGVRVDLPGKGEPDVGGGEGGGEGQGEHPPGEEGGRRGRNVAKKNKNKE